MGSTSNWFIAVLYIPYSTAMMSNIYIHKYINTHTLLYVSWASKVENE